MGSVQAQQTLGGDISGFLTSPLVQLVMTVLLALVVVVYVEREPQLIGILAVCIAFVGVSIIRAFYRRGTSGNSLQRDYDNLRSENLTLRRELEEIRTYMPNILKYSCVTKIIKILNNTGSAWFGMTYRGSSLSRGPLDSIRHVIGTKRRPVVISNPGVTVNNEPSKCEVEFARSGNAWKTQLSLFPNEAIKTGEPIDTSYAVELDGEYADAFAKQKMASSEHTTFAQTDKLVIIVESPTGYTFSEWKVDVRNSYNDEEVPEERLRVLRDCRPSLDSAKKKLQCEVSKPRMSYKYQLYFSLKEET